MFFAACLHKVLDERFRTEDEELESLHVLHSLDEVAHRTLTFRKVNSTVLLPESLVAHHGIGLSPFSCLSLEQFLRNLIEGIIAQTGCSHHYRFRKELRERQLHEHVINRQRPLAVRQLSIFLNYLQIVHEIDITFLWYREVAFLHMQRRVGNYEDFATETEVLLVVGQELQMIA